LDSFVSLNRIYDEIPLSSISLEKLYLDSLKFWKLLNPKYKFVEEGEFLNKMKEFLQPTLALEKIIDPLANQLEEIKEKQLANQ